MRRKLFIAIGFLLVAAVAGMTAAFYSVRPEQADTNLRTFNARNVADEYARAGFVDIPGSTAYFRVAGPEDGSLVVILPDPAVQPASLNGYTRMLGNAGYRVLVFDGYTGGNGVVGCRPHNPDLTNRLLMEIIDKQEINRRFHLIGHSHGGLIAAEFAAAHPEYVRSLTFISPSGFYRHPKGFLEQIATTPVFEKLFFRLFGQSYCRARAEEERLKLGGQSPEAQLFAQSAYMQHGHYPVPGKQELYRHIGLSSRPILVIWGLDDAISPYPGEELVLHVLPAAHLIPVEGAGHEFAYTRTPEITKVVQSFISDIESRPRSVGGIGGKPRGILARLESGRCESCSK